MMKLFLKIFVVLIILSVFAGTIIFLYQKSQKKPVFYKTANPFKTDIIKKTVAIGAILPRKEIEIKPQVSGIIEKIFVEAGSTLKKNDLIAKIKITPNMITLNNAESRLSKAEIALQDAQATYDREKLLYEKSIDQGQLSPNNASPQMLKLNNAEARLNKAKLALQDAQATYDREKILYEKSLTDQVKFQKILLSLNNAKEEYSEAFDNFKMVREETIDNTETRFQKADMDLDKAREEFKAAKNNLQLIKEGATESNIEETNTYIRSTIDGMVLDMLVKEGNSVVEVSTTSIGSTIAIVADMSDMIFEGNIDESEIGKIEIGMDLILTIAAIEDEKLNAIIEYISPKGIKERGAVQFTIRANIRLKESQFIRAGYSANADIVLDKRENVLAINESLLQFKDDSVFVEIETAPQHFVKKEIKVGLSDGINIEVISGLTEEDRIKII
jgi:HlyD family secretion protein